MKKRLKKKIFKKFIQKHGAGLEHVLSVNYVDKIIAIDRMIDENHRKIQAELFKAAGTQEEITGEPILMNLRRK